MDGMVAYRSWGQKCCAVGSVEWKLFEENFHQNPVSKSNKSGGRGLNLTAAVLRCYQAVHKKGDPACYTYILARSGSTSGGKLLLAYGPVLDPICVYRMRWMEEKKALTKESSGWKLGIIALKD